MISHRRTSTFFVCFFLCSVSLSSQQPSAASQQTTPQPGAPLSQWHAPELNTEMMVSTFRLQSTAGAGVATGFLLGTPFQNDPKQAHVVLVTATHVLNSMPGDSMLLIMRQKLANSWQEVPIAVPIRSGGRALWVQHPVADVAAMYVSIPTQLTPQVIPLDALADDKTLIDLEIHPGDELNVLGYPLGFRNPGGFAVLRCGKISSYPLVPTSENPYFLLDFRVFKGNSGGPVYFLENNRSYGGVAHFGTFGFVMGLVSEEIGLTQQFEGLYENRSETYPLALAKIVPASFIKETLNLLPPQK